MLTKLEQFVSSKLNISIQFIRYALVGVSGVTVDFFIFFVLTHLLHVNYLIANVLSVCSGITNNFTWNMLFTFNKRDIILTRFIRFFTVGIGGLIISSMIMFILVDVIKMYVLIAKGLTLIVITFLQYNLNRKYSFGDSVNKV
ncbi:GtrA family protein [candidate division WWE3 bacterium]|nr:GtrA family protein [candidate division WWE3 bacterium]